jgi:cytochrome P450 family 6
MTLLDWALLVGALISAAIYYIHRKYSYWSDKNVKFIKPIFPYGILRGAGKQLSIYEIVQNVYRETKPTGLRYVGVYFFIKPVALILDLDFIKTILIKDFNYFHDRGLYYNEKDDPLSAHLLAIEGQKWKDLRNKLTPTFSSGKMKMMFTTIVKIGEELKSTVATMARDSESIEIREVLARFTTDIIGSCAFGLECNSLKDPDAEFRRYGRNFFTARNPIMRLFATNYPNLARKLHLKVLQEEVSTFFLNAVRDTIIFREENNIVRNDFMDLMIHIKNSEDPSRRLTVNEIAAQAFIFFLAGFETSSTAMSCALYELALNSDVQNKARECVLSTLKKHGGVLTYEAMMEMGYISQCING